LNTREKIKWGRSYLQLLWFMLAVGLLWTVFASYQVKRAIEREWASQFAFTCEQATLRIQDRLDAYSLVLRGGAALFAATGMVSREEWRAYVETLRISGSVPGGQGLGFNLMVPADDLAAHIERIRGEGFPDYTVFPPGERPFYVPVVFIEPFRDRNLRAFGYDVYTEPVRRAALEQARDTGKEALTGRIELVQEIGADRQAGILMFEPVYHSGAAVDTVEQRRAALVGWVSGAFRMNDFMIGILGEWESSEGQTINLKIFAGTAPLPANQLFENQAKINPYSYLLLHQQRLVSFHGQQWLLLFERKTEATAINYALAWLTLVSGILLSGLLFGLMRSTIYTHANAKRIARELTEEMRAHEQALLESEEKIRLLLDSAAEAIYGIDVKGNCTFCNNASLRLLGYRHPDELLGNNMHWLIHGKYADGSFFPLEACRIFKAFNSGEPMHVDDEVFWRADGTSFPAEYWSYPQIREGVVVGAVVSFFDITERKRMEALLVESKQLLLTVVDTVPVRIFWKDANLRYLGCNLAFAKDAGMAHSIDLVGKDDYQLSWAALADQYRADDRSIIDSGTARLSYDEQLHAAGGKTIWIRTSKVPLLNADHTVVGIVGVFEDITARKQIEEELRISQDMLHMICTSAHDGIIMLDEDGNVALWSDAAARIFDVAGPDILGRDMHEMVVPLNFRPAFHKSFPHYQQTGEGEFIGKTFESIGLRQDGSRIPVEISLSKVQTARGWCSIGIVRDITERKKLLNLLSRSEAKLKATLYSIADGVIALDNNYTVVLMNRVAEQLSGWGESEALGKSIDEVLCLLDIKKRAPIVNPVAQVFQEKSAINVDFRLLLTARDGTERIISQSIAPIFDQINTMTGVVVVLRDLTAQVAEEQTMLNQSAIIQTFKGFAALADKEGTLVFINKGGSRMLGAQGPDELIGKSLSEVTQLSHFSVSANGLALPDGEATLWNGENLLRRLDGSTIPVTQTLFSIKDTNGDFKFIGVIMMDVSPMKTMQEQLLLSEKLSAMGRVLADVAHELNNPLAIIIGKVELMISQMAQPLSPIGKGLESVLQAARRCKILLGNLLAYRPIIDEYKDAINIPYLITEAIGTVHFQLDMSSIDIVTNYHINNIHIVGNKHSLLSVFVNLLCNARYSIDQHGSICITVVTHDEGRLSIEIEDTGTGMNEEQLSTLFQPFYSRWNDDRGNGLGLAASRGIIQVHGGEMWAESHGVGKGSKFKILLPYRMNRESQAVSEAGH
jgi:PAS domain S-box-containing protein